MQHQLRRRASSQIADRQHGAGRRQDRRDALDELGRPAKITSDPDSASAGLPMTGASTRPVAGGSADASRATAPGPTVDISTTVSEVPAPATTPSGPSVTARSAAGP